MKFTRKTTLILKYILEELLPPIIRDSHLFSSTLLRMAFGKDFRKYLSFRENILDYTNKDITSIYLSISNSGNYDITDLNQACENEILHSLVGKKILEVGCGNGLLIGRISKKRVLASACDLVINPALVKKYPKVKFLQADILKLPYKSDSFNTVICAHTLEHIVDIRKAFSELVRVSKNKVIIVVPKERPYKHTPNFHVHFFPYPENLAIILGVKSGVCRLVSGDIYYEYIKIQE